MTYTTNIPVSGDSLGGTRDRIRTNFQQIQSVFSENHVAFNDGGQGKHKYLQMPEVTASGAGIPTTGVNEGGLYVDVSVTTPTESNLFYRAESSGFSYQLTRVDSSKTTTFGTYVPYGTPPSGFTQSGGWTFLPGGLILQYGFFGKEDDLGFGRTVAFPIPFTNPAYSVTAIIFRDGASIHPVMIDLVPTNTNFHFATDSSGSDGIFWQAIGK